MNLCIPRVLTPPSSLDTLLQVDRIGKASLGYVLISDGKAMIVDPPRDPSLYLRAVHERDAELIGVADTHVHADYISGAAAIARDYGIPYYLHPSDVIYPYDGTPGKLAYTALTEGDTISLGRSSITVMHTPGHTEGSVTFRVGNELAFTGDFIFVASIGRPDLAGKTGEWAKHLWTSLQRARTEIASDCMILPAHYAHLSERNSDWSIGKLFGELVGQKRVFGMDSEEAFLSWVLGKEATFPEAYRTIKSVNVGLTHVTEAEAAVLESGKNECALG